MLGGLSPKLPHVYWEASCTRVNNLIDSNLANKWMKIVEGINGGVVYSKMDWKATYRLWMSISDMLVAEIEKARKEVERSCFVHFWYKIKSVFTRTKTEDHLRMLSYFSANFLPLQCIVIPLKAAISYKFWFYHFCMITWKSVTISKH